MTQPTVPDDDALPAEVDFSTGTRGKFFRPDAQVKLPADDANQGIEPTSADQ